MNLLLKLESIKDLSHNERQVVTFILKNPEQALNLGIVELAQQSFTSTSTIMRLCKKLEMNGFKDFKRQLFHDVNHYIDNSLLFQEQVPLEPGDSLSCVVDKTTRNGVRAVLDVRKFNRIETFEKVIQMMGKAKQIDFYGSGVSNLIAHDAMIKALRIGLSTTAYFHYSEMAMLSRTCGRDHLAIILSYTGYTEETLNIAKYLRQRNVPTISITSHTNNALSELCQVNLFVDSFESVYRIGGMSSRLSTLHLLDIIFAAYINENYDDLQQAIEDTFLPEIFHHLDKPLSTTEN